MNARIFTILLTGALLTWSGLDRAEAASNQTPQPNQTNQSTGTPRRLVEEVLKLLAARTSPVVVREFIRAWTIPYLTSVEDLRVLRQAGANADLIRTFSRQGAEPRLRASRQIWQNPGAHPGGGEPPARTIPVPAPRGLSGGLPAAESNPALPPNLFSEALWWWSNDYPSAWVR